MNGSLCGAKALDRWPVVLRWGSAHRRRLSSALVCVGVVVAVFSGSAGRAAQPEAEIDYEDAEKLFLAGDYEACEEAVSNALEDGAVGEEWHILKVEVQLAVGKFPDALQSYADGLSDYPNSVRLRWQGRRVYQSNNQPETIESVFKELESLVRRFPWRYRDPEDQITLGRYLLHKGTDARDVLEGVYDRVRKESPEFVGTYLAAGDLALEKQDFGVATKELRRALQLAPEHPEVHFRLAQALASDDPEQSEKHLNTTLEANPKHTGALLFKVDRAIDRELFDEARELTESVLDVHPLHPEAFAYRAVLRHLAGDFEAEKKERALALSRWATNPTVDHIIGRKLSQKYRFAEGSVYQRKALEFAPDYLPAKVQLCQDLLRLGEEEEGWQLAAEVYSIDGYNVVAHNLSVLHEHIQEYRTLEADGVVLRMDPREAGIYGDRALSLLRRAKDVLCEKYAVELDRPIVVEIFPQQKDFAIRTFGLPGGAGFLGVCFGNVITANSPASQGASPSNWEAVLWHEFCHVITLRKTKNRMPRWLSEGISVYEEKEENRTWGQSMIVPYLDIIEEGGVVPVSQLSGAFLQPPSGLHLQFAYYQSSLVVEYLIERHGFDKLKALLDVLAEGVSIHVALERAIGPIDVLDQEAEKFVRDRAMEFAAQADWEKPESANGSDAADWEEWLEDHPKSFWALRRRAERQIADEAYTGAEETLKMLVDLMPEYTGPANVYPLLASVYRAREEFEKERETLETLASRDNDAAAAYVRLLQLHTEAEDWDGVARNAERMFAVNPLVPLPHRLMAEAMEKAGTSARALESYRALLLMDPVDPAGLHFRLATALRGEGNLEGAKRQLLLAIAEAPRYRAAHRELLAVVSALATDAKPEGATTEGTPAKDSGTDSTNAGDDDVAPPGDTKAPTPTGDGASENDGPEDGDDSENKEDSEKSENGNEEKPERVRDF